MAEAKICHIQQAPVEYFKFDLPSKIVQKLEQLLTSAVEAFNTESYEKAARHFSGALDLMLVDDGKATTVILTKYMLCACWLESLDAKNLSDALKILEELENQYGHTYPMVYYAIGRAYFKLYRFNKADEILKIGFSVLNSDINVTEYCIPGTNIIIPESSKEHLVAALIKLREQCACWHRPDAVCCLADCSTINNNEAGDKNIFFANPTFIGMVQVTCNNPFSCTVRFHLSCWKAKKELLSPYRKMSDKEILHSECFTPSCNNKGIRCTIRRIEIFDENVQVKATIESHPDEAIWHPKITLPPRGAIRKQLTQTPKSNSAPSETRITKERARRFRKSLNEIQKVDDTEEEDDSQDELELKLAIENLKQLRAKNFGVKDDMIWRPNLSMYGNKYMLETSEALPDPDFLNDSTEEKQLKSSIFSYLHTLISNDGPVKLEDLNKNWHEAMDQTGIEELLLQSLKLAVVGGYICTADKLDEAYKLAKTDVCKTLKFSPENNENQQPPHSSADGKYGNSLPYSSIPGDDNNLVEECTVVSGVSMGISSNGSEKSIDKPNNVQSVEGQILPEAKTSIAASEMSANAIPLVVYDDVADPPVTKTVKKLMNSPELCVENINTVIRDVSPRPTVNGTHNVSDIENSLRCSTTRPTTVPDELINETESTSDLKTQIDGTDNFHAQMVDNTDETNGRPVNKNHNIAPESLNTKTLATLYKSISNICIRPDSEKSTSLVESNNEVQRLNKALAKSKEEIEELASLITQFQEANTELIRSLLKRILHKQYVHNDSTITEKLAEWKRNNNTFLEIQKLLTTFTGQTVPVATQSEESKAILDLIKTRENNRATYLTLNDQLSMSTLADMKEITLEDVPDLELPKFDLIGIVKSAFGLHRMHVLNEYSYMAARGQLPPQVQPMFNRHQTPVIPMGPPYGSLPSNLNQSYVYSSIPSMPPVPVFPVLNAMMVQQPRHNHFQTMYRPSSKYSMPDVSASTNQNGTFPLNPFPPPLPISNKSSEPKTRFIDNAPNLACSIEKSEEIDFLKMQQIIKVSDKLNGRTSKITESSLPVQREQPRVHVGEQVNAVQAHSMQQQNWLPAQNLEHPASKTYQTSHELKMQASLESSICAPPPPAGVPYRSPKSNNENLMPSSVVIGSDIARCNDINMNTTEGIPQYDTYTNPALTPKDVERMTSNDSRLGDVAQASGVQTKGKPFKKTGHSIDRLMRRLRSRYPGVLELDLLKSVECVREKHHKSLSRVPMHNIIHEVHVFIGLYQLKQLCKYDTDKQDGTASRQSNYPHFSERKRRDSVSSTSSASSLKYDSLLSKKLWAPITVPNATWVNENKQSECAICFENMFINAESYTLQCKHAFHKKCIKQWYQHNQSCPTCRVHSMIDDDYPPLS